MPNNYENMSTNAQVLEQGNRTLLSRDQIDALAQLEHEWVEGMWRGIPNQFQGTIENVLHVFICDALGDCVCPVEQNKEVYQ